MRPAAAVVTGALDGQSARQTEVRVGLRLRAARERRGLSLREVARRTGLSPSFISQVERDRVTPSIASLKQLAAALGERVGVLLADPAPEGLVLRQGDRPTWELARVHYQQLAPDGGRLMQPQLLRFEPGGDLGEHPVVHEGEEFGLVLSGRVECFVGEQSFVLEEGDSVYFDARLPHRTRNAADAVSVYLLVVTPATF
ncbi:MAG TPA: XRE family transcriptional regulator [Chloroflexota bacterium]|nr:XRE family transcriptional regulator [Chloroflexota bacterium]